MSTLRYKILVAPFPFGDLTAKKTRPVLCLTDLIGKYDELVLAYITTKNSLTTSSYRPIAIK